LRLVGSVTMKAASRVSMLPVTDDSQEESSMAPSERFAGLKATGHALSERFAGVNDSGHG